MTLPVGETESLAFRAGVKQTTNNFLKAAPTSHLRLLALDLSKKLYLRLGAFARNTYLIIPNAA